MKQRKKQIRLTTAELALHYGGLGAGPPTSEVQEVKRLHCLPMQIVLLQLNNELNQKGYLTIPGRISRQYLYERLYGGKQKEASEHARLQG